MKHTLKLGMLVAALTTAELASAEPIIVFDTFRLVSANRITHNNFALGPWSDSITGKDNAGQDTTISNVFAGGSGFADARLGDNQDLSSSSAAELRASFFLELITHASLDVELFQAGDGGFARASLRNATGTMSWNAFTDGGLFSDGGPAELKEELILPRGAYDFLLIASAGVTPGFAQNGFASFNGGLTLTPIEVVPEPGTLSLLGIGLVTAAIRRRRIAKTSPDQRTPLT